LFDEHIYEHIYEHFDEHFDEHNLDDDDSATRRTRNNLLL